MLGDIIVEIAGKKVRSYDEIRDILDPMTVGDEVRVTLNRNGATVEVSLRLAPLE